ncbi:APG6-domain-containing protein [Pterulicium gracile]|uniref:APG6-domain-containing protein n=1 Tax=Pterulicium gracile TaxID=1884261 RepID=A0A5C3QRK4_9AGAR|nr:APG6-domain-containing protein [Pterula gracilis]
MNFVCQQCKEPLELDTSLIDLAPSAYDMIAASLPPDAPKGRQLSEAEKLAALPSPSSVKAAWQRSSKHSTPGARGQEKARHSPHPSESFVLLQDSVIHNIPSTSSAPSTPTHGKRPSISISRAGSSKAGDTPSASVKPEPELPLHPPPLSHHLKASLRLFNLLSSRTDLDHPLCAECTQILLTSLQRQLDETKKERDGYIAYEKEVRKEKEREAQGMSKEEADMKIDKLKAEERLAISQIQEAEREREQLDEELRLLELESQALEEEEANFWKERNEQLLISDQQTMELASLRAAYAADSDTLEKLERTNVYNDAFCIGHDGVFGTINGLRLGRVPGVVVDWAEINAAWGQTLLLLYTIARKLDYTFESYRLVPMGSFSRIEKATGDKASYELYGSGDLHFGRLLHNRRFDFAMVAFLDCLKNIIDFVKSQDSQVDFPHQISKDKIGEASVKLQFNQEEAWTRSLRHVLLALKILLKWTTNGGAS